MSVYMARFSTCCRKAWLGFAGLDSAWLSEMSLGFGSTHRLFRVSRLAANISSFGRGNQPPVFGFIDWQPTSPFRV